MVSFQPSFRFKKMTLSSGPPTQGRAYQELVEDELLARSGGQVLTGDAQLINVALKLEYDQ